MFVVASLLYPKQHCQEKTLDAPTACHKISILEMHKPTATQAYNATLVALRQQISWAMTKLRLRVNSIQPAISHKILNSCPGTIINHCLHTPFSSSQHYTNLPLGGTSWRSPWQVGCHCLTGWVVASSLETPGCLAWMPATVENELLHHHLYDYDSHPPQHIHINITITIINTTIPPLPIWLVQWLSLQLYVRLRKMCTVKQTVQQNQYRTPSIKHITFLGFS